MNQEIRQLALQGKWRPTDGGTVAIALDTNGTLDGILLFPDEQTRTEYLQVAQGTWSAKKGDNVYLWHSVYDFMDEDLNTGCDWPYKDGDRRYHFPSAEQRASFIAKRKGEEPKPFPYLTGDVKGEEPEIIHMANLNPPPTGYVFSGSPKPQTITICISDEAIKQAANCIITGMFIQFDGEDIQERAECSIRTIVALLHLEATLNS